LGQGYEDFQPSGRHYFECFTHTLSSLLIRNGNGTQHIDNCRSGNPKTATGLQQPFLQLTGRFILVPLHILGYKKDSMAIRKPTMSKKRRFSRLPLKKQCILTSQGDSGHATLVDISLKGALLECDGDRTLPVGSTYFLTITLIPSEINLDFKVAVIHVDGNLVGVRFDRMELETMVHLRALLEANTGDPDRIRNELNCLVE
jgi:PilZ domain